MITREDFFDFTGIDDPRLANPTHRVPPLRFATIPHGNTEAVLKRNKPRMHTYMKQFNTTKSSDGVKQVRNGNLDAFIYDAVVLDYMAGQDPDCRKCSGNFENPQLFARRELRKTKSFSEDPQKSFVWRSNTN